MLSTLPAQQFIVSDMSYLGSLEPNNQVLFTDLADNHDTQSLPSLTSPNPSTKDLSDAVDDDDDEMEYENFATGPSMAMENAFPWSTLQLQPPVQYPYSAMMSTVDNMCPDFQLQYHQGVNALPLQQQLSMAINSTPTMGHFSSYSLATSVLEPCSSTFHFGSIGQQPQYERSILESMPTMDVLVAPRLGGNACSADSIPQLMASPTSTAVQSPTVSWASLSRESTPACMPSPVIHRRPVPRPVKRRSGSTCSRSAGRASGSDQTVFQSASSLEGTHQAHEDAVSSTPIRRKRRVRHIKMKIKPTTFECDAPGCGKIFSRAYNLTSHMKTHSSERPFKCDSCSLAFARRHDRERHVRLHTGEKPYTCDSCGCGFMRNDALHRHQRICGQSAWMALMQQQQRQQRPSDIDADDSIIGCEDASSSSN
ncbi:hypothetical protein BGX31_005626 [Mortierella sp. GBA43]|nr:hypothetical protein BGX31_005626 [Mortierella sp. GBA43]